MVRLKDWEIKAIKKVFDDLITGSEIFVYGSRADETKKGGDIDLLVYCDSLPDYDLKTKILRALYDELGEQKIDILYSKPDSKDDFVSMISSTAVKL